jgi:hypothetical protein
MLLFFNDKIIKLKLYVFISFISVIVILDIIFKVFLKAKFKLINIDNLIEDSFFEDDIDFSNYSTDIKAIAIYYPNFNLSTFVNINFRNCIYKENKKNYWKYYFEANLSNNINKTDFNKYITDYYKQKLINQINLAKTHGIYGFGFYLYMSENFIYFEKYINFFLSHKSINFKFLFVLYFSHITIVNREILVSIKYIKNNLEDLIDKLRPFLLDQRYIKYNNKSVICIDNLENIQNIKIIIQLFRKFSKKLAIGELYILSPIIKKDITKIREYNIFDGGYESIPNYFPKRDMQFDFQKNLIFFSELVYKRIPYEIDKNFSIYKSSLLEQSLKISNQTTFLDYSSKYFYIMNNFIINYTKNNFNDSNTFIFLYSWNNYYNGFYLEPDCELGYSSLNAFSKALFNISFKERKNNLNILNDNIVVAVQAHIFYIELVNDIINKTNNIPTKFDLYITTNSRKKEEYIKKYIEKYSRSNNYQIEVFMNQGRDIFPFLIQMKKVFHKYKYICHIHSKKSITMPELGSEWRNYLYKNILGSKEIIFNILTDFEENEKLGFIFPETFYDIKMTASIFKPSLINLMNYLVNKMFKGYKIGDKIDFPAGNMFWARNKAIYQIFQLNLKTHIFLGKNRYFLFLYAIERIWLYIIKFNGYYYKKILV